MVALLDMGGFGGYIWTSYGVAVLCLGWLTHASCKKEKNAVKLLAELQDNQTDKIS